MLTVQQWFHHNGPKIPPTLARVSLSVYPATGRNMSGGPEGLQGKEPPWDEPPTPPQPRLSAHCSDGSWSCLNSSGLHDLQRDPDLPGKGVGVNDGGLLCHSDPAVLLLRRGTSASSTILPNTVTSAKNIGVVRAQLTAQTSCLLLLTTRVHIL